MYENIKNSIYKVITADGTGTGFKLQGYDFIITNYHVISGHKKVCIEDNEKECFIAHVVLVNPEIDIALLSCKELISREGAIKISAETKAENMQKIFIYGFPFGMPLSTTEGIISSANQPVNDRFYIQTDAAVNPGNSGGAMIDESGFLVAVIASKFTNADNVGFGIKHTDLLCELESFKFQDDKFRLKCNSCDAFIEEKNEFCQNCGNRIDSQVFEDYQLSPTATFVENALKNITSDTVLLRGGRDFWTFYHENAPIKIFLSEERGEEFLLCTSAINELAKENLEELFYQIITKNIAPFTLGIAENKIFISYSLSLSDIKTSAKDEIAKNLALFPKKAVELSRYFLQNYKCEFSFESKSVNK